MAVPDGYNVFTLEPAGVADVAFSPDQTLLYAAMKNGDVEVFDVATHQKVATWHVGTSLGALSLTPDGTGILVVERQPAAGVSTLYRVDTATGLATAYSQAGGASFYDVEVVDAHTALLTGGGQNKNSLFNLDSNSFGALSGGVYYSNGRSALVEDQHLTLLSEAGISNGPMYIFDDRSHSFTAYGDDYQTIAATGNGYSTGFNFGNNAISEAAGKVVQFIYYGSLLIYDLNLKLVGGVSVGAPVEGLTFDVTGSYLYGYFPDSGVVKKFNVADWSVVTSVPVGTMSWDSNGATYNDQLLVDASGRNFVTLQALSSGFYANEGKLVLTTVSAAYATGPTSGDDVIAGGVNADTLSGGDGNDTLYGREGGDTLDGGNGNDTLYGEDGNDILIGGAGADTLDGGNGSDLLFSRSQTPGVTGTYFPQGLSTDTGTEHDVLKGGAGDDVIFAGYGDDVDGGAQDSYGDKLAISFLGAPSGVSADFRLLATQATMTIGGGTITGIEDAFSIEGSNFDDLLVPYCTTYYPNGEFVYGRGGNDHIIATYYTGFGGGGLWGGDGDDVLDGSGSVYGPSLYGEAGNDTLIGGWNGARMAGGTGNDVYYLNSAYDTIVENPGEGTDEVRTSFASYTLGNNLENLTGLSNQGQALTGNTADNVISGGDGNDVIDGGAGADTMIGGKGNDVYYVDDAGDVVTEGAGEGTDEVRTTIAAYTLPDNVETLTGLAVTGQSLTGNGLDNQITGRSGNDSLYGGAGNDSLSGGDGNDSLDGGAGADTMTGGKGDDVYYVDNANDVVIENAGEGTDEVRTTLANYALPANVEKLTYVGAGNWTFTGGAGNDNVAASGGNDFFDLSQGGADTASGGGGNDAFSFGAAFGAGDSVDGGAGSDTVGI
ncbi:MAG: hypothetical protein JO013_12750, partial [Alphaproteobacteria bacterium]|nr:hypothetical protein [Alphaproteobacteria bacterium]